MELRIKDIPLQDRPYEKCERLGAEHLSDRELLAVILRTAAPGQSPLALADQVLTLNYPMDGLTGLLHLTGEQLRSLPGIGKVKSLQLLCIAQLCGRIARQQAVLQHETFQTPQSAADYYMEALRHQEQEHIYVMLLNTRNRLIRDLLIAKGTVETAVTTPREILIRALQYHAVSMILVHNHPSGDPSPSQADLDLTRQLSEAGKLIGIPLLDHIIIGDGIFTSLALQAGGIDIENKQS